MLKLADSPGLTGYPPNQQSVPAPPGTVTGRPRFALLWQFALQHLPGS